jgi:hypothetical protein
VWIAHDERLLGAEDAAMQRPRDRHEVVRAAQHERSVAVRGKLDGSKRMVDHVLARPSE